MYADTMTGAGSRPMWPSRRGRTSAPGGGGLSSLRTQHTGGPYTAAPVAAELAALAWRSLGRALIQGSRLGLVADVWVLAEICEELDCG